MVRAAVVLVVSSVCLAQDARLGPILARVSEEAEVFRSVAPKIISQETLVQRARKQKKRSFPIRIGKITPEPVEIQTREIVSEYGFAALQSAPGDLHEFREVVRVDGRQVATEEKAREALAAGLRSADDRRRKKMLERFEKHGLVGAATDFGQLILLFSRRRLGRYDFTVAGEGRIGADRVIAINFKEKPGQGSLLIFEQRQAIYQPVQGQIWVRDTDFLPVRMVLVTQRESSKITLRDEATVDYVRSTHGLIVPAAVTHRQFTGPELTVENVFRYTPFRMFAAEAEIKFQ